MTLTNRQILEHVQALRVFNPPGVPYRTTTRLARNLRKLNLAAGDYDHDRSRILYASIKDQSKAAATSGQNQEPTLSPEEQAKFQPEIEKLLAETQEVEIHPVEVIDSDEGHAPEHPDFVIDRSVLRRESTDIHPSILATLLDTVFEEWRGGYLAVPACPARNGHPEPAAELTAKRS